MEVSVFPLPSILCCSSAIIRLDKVGTQYYFRYNGSLPEPPCFEGVHWRVMKHPIPVAPSQIERLQELVARRLNPETCKKDTVGKRRYAGQEIYDINRPLQTVRHSHTLVYCECVDWKSHERLDNKYCRMPPKKRGIANVTWPTLPPKTTSPSMSSAPSAIPTPSPTPWDDPWYEDVSSSPSVSTGPSEEPSTTVESPVPTECVCDPRP